MSTHPRFSCSCGCFAQCWPPNTNPQKILENLVGLLELVCILALPYQLGDRKVGHLIPLTHQTEQLGPALLGLARGHPG